MRTKRFAVLVAVLVVAASAIYGSGVMGTSAEADDSDEQRYRWLAGTGMTDFGDVCGAPGCPDEATTGADHEGHPGTIELVGEGMLSVEAEDGEDFDPKGVTGGGSFRIVHAGHADKVGTWTAKRLVSFVDFGASPCVVGDEPGCDFEFNFPTARSGLAVIRVKAVVDGTGEKFDAILQVGCQLPGTGVVNPEFEGIKFEVRGGLNFTESATKSTLFVHLGDADGDGERR